MKTYTVFSSDITGKDLVVMDGEGNKIENIVELTLRASAGELISLDITVMGAAINTQATMNEVTFICPHCEEYVNHDCRPTTLGGT